MLNDEAPAASRIALPPVPESLRGDGVACWSEPLSIDSYLPGDPDQLPAFLEQRVYQGSSGRVFPLPFHERISQTKEPHEWQAVHLENRWLRVVVLPELGGRIHIGYDKVADYDFFYRNNVIKPALVGLAGPWISGGVEFNWPQHHRPATFLPTDVEIEHEADGSVTVWCSDHDPFARMKGMHGIRLRPDSAVIEARVRLYNRTPETQTFLWWANVAAAVDDEYQSFFPRDVEFVADHAKRAIATFPEVDGSYYGVDYPARRTAERPDGDRLDWYRNIPVPTSYMVTRTSDDFFGGYDHGREAGFVHWADRHIAPGKKQWTWGNAPFGWAWDANLTDDDGPYVELMAGAYTDNQPDFSFLAPGETKTFSQYWYPIQRIGPVDQATLDAAGRLDSAVDPDSGTTSITVGVAVTAPHSTLAVRVETLGGEVLYSGTSALEPGAPLLQTVSVPGVHAAETMVLVVASPERELLRTRPHAGAGLSTPPESATEPPQPADVASIEELFYIGQYLYQYRHATRLPEPYWREALRRDPNDTRSNVALAERLTWSGAFDDAEVLLRRAVSRLTARVPNPADGEAHYRLGLVLVLQGRDAEAEEFLQKATWNAAWRVAASFALAQLAARAGRRQAAEQSARAVLRVDGEHLQAAALLATLLQERGADDEAAELLHRTLATDPLDQWSRILSGREYTADAPTLLDVALEFTAMGSPEQALDVFDRAAAAAKSTALGQVQVEPLVHYHRASVLDLCGRPDEAAAARAAARHADRRYSQASRHADVAVLREALAADPLDELAAVLLGNWHYDKRRYTEAIGFWEQAIASGEQGAHADAAVSATLTMAHRNLGIAAYNVLADGDRARSHYASALGLSASVAKLWFENDQLAERLGESDQARVAVLEQRMDLVQQRDDLSVAFAELLTRTGRAADAHHLLSTRLFQPWEGGEGRALAAWENANVALAYAFLQAGDLRSAAMHVESSIHTPASLGEARHDLANSARLHLLKGDVADAQGNTEDAVHAWQRAASFTGDFQGMSTRTFSDQTYFSVLALLRLGEVQEADRLRAGLEQHVSEIALEPATIDYFATSLPTMLLFTDDPQTLRNREIDLLREQLALLGEEFSARVDHAFHETIPAAPQPFPRQATAPAVLHTEKGTP
ncbi:DUF5107 domain-containing protein [Subtercola sp. Z020]|uniref:tetratricopeptide repeat protein n=1 Tax=Subtercola sp. Z020 TaxID=2080582 RepID=UPI000CE826E4|nr:DUF5107 domain-containing protein [Subtercola sp. Z020]PPF90110.1 DUF5107 domain-containing protein [Subtercola sp. Z020]